MANVVLTTLIICDGKVRWITPDASPRPTWRTGNPLPSGSMMEVAFIAFWATWMPILATNNVLSSITTKHLKSLEAVLVGFLLKLCSLKDVGMLGFMRSRRHLGTWMRRLAMP